MARNRNSDSRLYSWLDLASAHEKSLHYLLQHPESLFVANIGTGRGYSILEVIEQCEKIIGYKIKRKFLPKRRGDPPVLIADSSLAHSKLNWRATQSDLESLISSAKLWLEKKHIIED